MTDISVLGLGLMGAALAQALIKAGHSVTVWNRTQSRMTPLVEAGARPASDVADLVRSSSVLLVCINDYDTTETVLGADDVAELLDQRTFIQCSSGTPKEAEMAEQRMVARGAQYIDGAILASPPSIGTEHATLLFSGNATAFDTHSAMLNALGGTVRFVGTKPGQASALDLSWLTILYGRFIGAVHASMMCEAEGVALDDLIALVPEDPHL